MVRSSDEGPAIANSIVADGPQPPSAELYDFLETNNITATHFMIGSRIVDNPDLFQRAVEMGGEIAVQ